MKKGYKNMIQAAMLIFAVSGMMMDTASGQVRKNVRQETIVEIKEEAVPLASAVTVKRSAGVAFVLDQTLAAQPETEETEESEYSNFAIANVDNYVNVRSTPGTDGEIVGKMYDDSVAQILSVVGEGEEEWFQVISGSVEGYIKSEYFIYGEEAAAVIDDYVTRYIVVKADRLNVRKEPDMTAPRIGYMDNGEKGELLEAGDEWMKVSYTDGKEGYVASQYVMIEEQFTYAKSIEEEQQALAEQLLLEQRAQESEETVPENTTVQITPPPTDYANVSELRSSIVNYAMQYLGNRYISGGRSLSGGTDCSGFTSYTYAAFGYSLSRTPQGQWGGNGRYISIEEAKPGDIVCYSSNGSRCTHVGIYIGNGQIIHSANSRKGVIISDIYYDNTFIGIKNVID